MNTQPEPCTLWDVAHIRSLWSAAILLYAVDAKNAMYSKTAMLAEWEALDDLTGSGELLANLCDPLELDMEMVRAALLEVIAVRKKIR